MSETTKARGFAALSPEQRRAMASKGGKAVHAAGTAHAFTTEEMRRGGATAGAVAARDTAHMAELGRRGGRARHRRRDPAENESTGSEAE